MVTKKKKKSGALTLSHQKYNAKLIFGTERDEIVITLNEREINRIHFYGLKGHIQSLLFIDSTNYNRISKEQLENDIIESFKPSILKKLITITKHSPRQIQKHRDILMKIVMDDDFGFESGRLELGYNIPVELVDIGWKKLGELYNKNIYVELAKSDIPSERALRTARMGYYVVSVRSTIERDMVKRIINAQDLDQLPNSQLEKINVIIDPEDKLKTFLENSAEILQLLRKVKSDLIKPRIENNVFDSAYVANSFAAVIQKDLPDYEVEKVKLVFTKPGCRINKHNVKFKPKLRPCYENSIIVNDIKLTLCKLDRDDINALTNPKEREIFINISSRVIKNILDLEPKVQKALLLEELSHEFTHILGYGNVNHDLQFFKMQRILKYKVVLKSNQIFNIK